MDSDEISDVVKDIDNKINEIYERIFYIETHLETEPNNNFYPEKFKHGPFGPGGKHYSK